MLRPNNLLVFTLCFISLSCSENIPDCPSKMCIISGGWRLTEASLDGIKDNGDLSRYSLVLGQPTPATNSSAAFNRIQPSGNEDTGSWSLTNNDHILQLTPNDDTNLREEWIIESFSPRRLILVINRDTDVKQGPSTIRFILEPF